MALRPIGRMSLSWKRMDMPSRVPTRMSLSPSVRRTPISSSSSRSTMAIRPARRRFMNSLSSVRLIVPLRVAMTR